MKCSVVALLIPSALLLGSQITSAQQCAAILADAGEKSLDAVTALHFQCAVTDQLKDGVPSDLQGLADLSASSIQKISYTGRMLDWKVPRGPGLTEENVALCNSQLELLMDNALERRGWFVAAVRQELKDNWSIRVDPDSAIVEPDTPQPAPAQAVELTRVYTTKTIYVRKTFCERKGLFGRRTQLVTRCVPMTIQTCTLVPVAPPVCCPPPSCCPTPSCCVAASPSKSKTADVQLATKAPRIQPQRGELRWWHNTAGDKSSSRAALLDVVDEICLLRAEDGPLMSCRLDELDAANIQYVQAWENSPGASPSDVAFRVYHDVTKEHHAKLALVGVDRENGVFIRGDGDMILVPLDKLSSEDRQHVASWRPANAILLASN